MKSKSDYAFDDVSYKLSTLYDLDIEEMDNDEYDNRVGVILCQVDDFVKDYGNLMYKEGFKTAMEIVQGFCENRKNI